MFAFAEFLLSPEEGTLMHRGYQVRLQDQPLRLLALLAERAGEVVTRDEIQAHLWPDNTYVDFNRSLRVAVNKVREALHDSAENPKYVETVPRRGYRLIAPVTVLPHEADTLSTAPNSTVVVSAAPGPSEQPDRKRSPLFYWLALVTVVAVAALSALLGVRVNSSHWRVIDYQQLTHDGNTKTLGGTDGSRIYFTAEPGRFISQMAATGGTVVPLDIPPEFRWVGDVSPDGSKLLVISNHSGMGPSATLWTFQILGGALRRIGNAVNAAWSPGGDRIIYATGSGDLYICQSDGSDAQKLISPGGFIKSISWSPDGRLIRFSKEGRIWEVGIDGSNLRLLLPEWKAAPTQSAGQWVRDGRYYFVSDGQIWIQEDRSLFGFHWQGAPVQLTSGPVLWDRPIPSPDGSRLIASGQTRRGELIRRDPRSGQLHTFLNGLSAEFLAYSKDGESLVYVTFPEGALWRANKDGSHATQITSPPVYPKSIRWSPDGGKILFVDSNAQGINKMYTVPADGGGRPIPLLPDDREPETDPSWSPDGSKVVFATSQYVGVSTTSELRQLDIATNTVSKLQGSEGLIVPRWSPDGSTIAALTLDAMNVKFFSVATHQWSAARPGAISFPEWSRDSRSLYYIDWRERSLVRCAVRDGRSEILADMKGERLTGFYTGWMGLDPEDAPLTLRDIGRDEIYALSLEKE
jgi:Tol biopolymer transport system component/DNA-binding winged helix-turn-helix (wHTH) protein